PGRLRQQRVLWVDITVGREFAAGQTRPKEEVTVVDGTLTFDARAVVPPRRVLVRLALVRGDTASSPRAVDLVPETPGRRVSFAPRGRGTSGAGRFPFDAGGVGPRRGGRARLGRVRGDPAGTPGAVDLAPKPPGPGAASPWAGGSSKPESTLGGRAPPGTDAI